MKKFIEASTINKENNLYHITKGIVASVLFTLIGLTIFAAILTYTEVSENTILPVIIILSSLSILIGSSISTIKIKKYGLFNGIMIGGIYMALLYFISSITKTGFAINTNTFIMILASILAGMIGGVVGVNIR